MTVLILTSHNSVEGRVAGLNLGDDDCLGKPFSFRRIPSAALEATVSLSFADIRIDKKSMVVTRSHTPRYFTPRELDLLVYLLDRRNHTVSREMLAKDVWSEVSRCTPLDDVTTAQMARLRRKLDDSCPRQVLHTARGMGFSLRESAQ